MMKNRLCVMIFLLFLPLAAFGKANDPPTIPLGKVSTVWKGIGNLPFWTRSVFSINDTYSVKLSEETTIFRLGLIWQTMNQTMSPKRGTLITRVEKETCPDSGEWGLLFEAINEVISKKGSDEDIVVTRDICQEEPEARYRITMQTLMPFGQKTKPKTTCLTVCLTSKAYTIYTSVSLIPLFTPHNLGENGSYTRLLSAADLAGLSGMGIEDARVRIEGQEALGFDLSNARIEINPVTEDTLRIDYFPAKQGTTSSLLSENLCLRASDPGDTYVLLKDLPLRIKFITTFTLDKKEIKTATIRVVDPQEARQSKDRRLDLILLPAVVWQPYDQTHPIIGSVTSIADESKGIEIQEEATKELKEQPQEQEKRIVEEQEEEIVKEVVKEVPLPISLTAINQQEEVSEQTINLLTNGNFSSGLEGWELIKKGAGTQIYAQVITDDLTHPYALEIKRKGSRWRKGFMGVSQTIDKDISTYSQLTIKAKIKIIYSSLRSDGNRGGVYPMTIRMDYIDDQGKTHSWEHGLLYPSRINYPEKGKQIERNIWHTYTSANLMELSHSPCKIKKIQLLGQGWAFHSRITGVELIGK